MSKLSTFIKSFLGSYFILVAGIWGFLEAYTYFQDDHLKKVLGPYWWIIYVLPLFISLFMAIGVTKSEKLRQFFEWFLRQWRYFVISTFFITVEFFLYLSYEDWRLIVFSTAYLVLVILFEWLLRWRRMERADILSEFTAFEHSLVRWEYVGNWYTSQESDQTILVVTDSGKGGIAKPCLSWRNYIFEFETKIINKYTSWIVRAEDINNYVMLQCHSQKMYHLFCNNGNWAKLEWCKEKPISLPVNIPWEQWFGVRIEVRGEKVIVILTVEGKRIEVLNQSILEPPIAPKSYAVGSVGFRESGSECAHFRNIHVTPV